MRPDTAATEATWLPQLLLCSFLYANAFLVMKLIGADIAPIPLAALRGTVGGALIAAWFLARRQSIVPRGREWRDWFVLGTLQGSLPNALTAYALFHITAGLTSMIQASAPLLIVVLCHLLFPDERMTARRGAGVVAGFAGMAILIGPAAFSGGSSRLGAWAMVATAVSYAVANIYVRSIPRADPARLALGQQVFSGLPLLAAVLLTSGRSSFAAVPDHAVSLAALGVLGTGVPMVLFMHILRTAGPTRGSMNAYLIPIWTVLLGFVFLDEAVGAREAAGGLVVLAGVALVSTARRRREASP